MTIDDKAKPIKLLCLDVDGTLTDGKIFFDSDGMARRFFHTLDGLGIQRFIQSGGVVAIITAAKADEINLRARYLGIQHIYQEVADKLAVVKSLLTTLSLSPEQVAFAGDDFPDLSAMQYVGLACAPATAMPSVLAAAHYIPRRPAGAGAVREICEFIISAQSTT